MIHIAEEKWYLGGDPLNITLYQKKVGKEGKSKGQERYEECAYYNTFQELMDGFARKKIRLNVSTAESLKEINDNINEIHDTIRWFCKKFENEIEERMKDEKNREGTKNGEAYGSDTAVSD